MSEEVIKQLAMKIKLLTSYSLPLAVAAATVVVVVVVVAAVVAASCEASSC